MKIEYTHRGFVQDNISKECVHRGKICYVVSEHQRKIIICLGDFRQLCGIVADKITMHVD